MVLSLVLAVILFVCVAMLVREGLWSNALTLINAIFAALVATSLWEPLAGWLEGLVPSGTYLWDFVALWAIFCVCFLVLRAVTDLISRVRVRFKRPVDTAGGILLAVLVGWMMVCFTAMTLHTAPLAQRFMRGDFYDQPDDKIFLGMMAPDRQWFGFAQQLSNKSMAGSNVLGTNEQFINRYGERRKQYETVQGILAQ